MSRGRFTREYLAGLLAFVRDQGTDRDPDVVRHLARIEGEILFRETGVQPAERDPWHDLEEEQQGKAEGNG